MLVATDVHYSGAAVAAACVAFANWTDAAATQRVTISADQGPQPYAPGEFYKRELPYLLAVLARVEGNETIQTIVVDGYVWLGPERPGLGARLYDALGGRIPVVGVAKTGFWGAPALQVRRGRSAKPLYVTAIGMDAQRAAAAVGSMHGEYRIPGLLKLVDRLARSGCRTQ